MLTTTGLSSEHLAGAASQPDVLANAGRLSRLLSRCKERLALLFVQGHTSGMPAIGPDEAGDATLRDLGLESRRHNVPFDLVDIQPGIEATRMHLFTMTGRYWRGS